MYLYVYIIHCVTIPIKSSANIVVDLIFTGDDEPICFHSQYNYEYLSTV